MTGCATGGAGGDDDGNTVDSGVVNLADSAPGQPDADISGLPDAAPTSCDLVAQTGCMPGQACDLGEMNAHECREVTTPGMETSTCTGATGCAAGYACIGGGGPTSCMEYCTTDANCTAPGGLCLITLVDGNQVPIPGVTMCTQNCDPLAGTGCPTQFGCNLYRENAGAMRFLTQCDPAGAAGQEQQCTDNSSCQAGFSCYCTSATQPCPAASLLCLKNCNATDNIGCAGVAGTTCQGIGAVLGGKEYGACL